MEARAGGFADGVESAQAGFAVEVGLHPAALVVCCWDDGNRLLRDIDAELQARLVDVRESGTHEIRRLVRDVDVHALAARTFHLGVDRAGDHVARREFGLGMIAVHEPPTPRVDQLAPSPRTASETRKDFASG